MFSSQFFFDSDDVACLLSAMAGICQRSGAERQELAMLT